MTAEELIATYRQRADDAVEPYLLSDERAIKFLAEGESEACLRAKLLYDQTSTFTQIAITAGTSRYALDARIDRIDSASFSRTSGGRPRDLEYKGVDWVRDQSDWRSRTGCPEVFYLVDRVLHVWPTPASGQAGTLQLAAYRFPRYPIEDTSDEPEIPGEHHEGLVDWVVYRLYSTKDSEAYDPQRAETALAAFTDRFGERPSANVLRRHREKRRVTARYGGL